MGILIGALMFVFGTWGTVGSVTHMENDKRYTYVPPLTDHEETVYAVFIISLLVAVTGVLVIIFSIIKKRNDDRLNNLMNMASGRTRKNVCTNCGLNLAEEVAFCPKCGNSIRRE